MFTTPPSIGPGRARSRGTPPRSRRGGGTRLRGRRARTAPRPRSAVPSATTFPADTKTTRSQSRSTSSMLWLVTSSAVPSSAQSRSSPVRTRSATSGSSDAVGSSSTSSVGWCSVAFTIPTSVRWPDDSSLPIAFARWVMLNRCEPGLDGRRRVASGRRGARRARGTRRPGRARAAGGSRPRSPTSSIARLRSLGELVSGDLAPARVGRDHAEQHHERRRLARRRSGPRSATRSPASTRQRDAVDGADALVLLDEAGRAEDGRAEDPGRTWTCGESRRSPVAPCPGVSGDTGRLAAARRTLEGDDDRGGRRWVCSTA